MMTLISNIPQHYSSIKQTNNILIELLRVFDFFKTKKKYQKEKNLMHIPLDEYMKSTQWRDSSQHIDF